MVLKKNNEMMENFAKVSTSRLYTINLQHIFVSKNKTSHFGEMRKQNQTKIL